MTLREMGVSCEKISSAWPRQLFYSLCSLGMDVEVFFLHIDRTQKTRQPKDGRMGGSGSGHRVWASAGFPSFGLALSGFMNQASSISGRWILGVPTISCFLHIKVSKSHGLPFWECLSQRFVDYNILGSVLGAPSIYGTPHPARCG